MAEKAVEQSSLPPNLSKSLFLQGLQCHKALWLRKNKPKLAAPISEAQLALFDQGNKVGELARKYFPDGHRIKGGHFDFEKALEDTQSAISLGAPVLFEGAASYNGVRILADILQRTSQKDQTWNLIEVKSSTKEKPEHIPDLAIQYFVLQQAGFKLEKARLMLINNQYVRKGSLDLNELFYFVDMTPQVLEYLEEVPKYLQEFRAILSQDEPDRDIGPHCFDPNDCAFISHCWSNIPEYSIFNLTMKPWKKIMLLRQKGILKIDDIPSDFPLSSHQMVQVQVQKTGKPIADLAEIRRLLDELRSPLYFLDFETINPPIPQWDDSRPYQNIPFQFSLRTLEATGENQHMQYLGDGRNDPREELVKGLVNNLGFSGTVIVYNKKFESSVIKDLATIFPEYAQQLLDIEKRLWDLYVPFQKRIYVHPDFKGEASIKTVLPVFVPELTYKNLSISDGLAASRAYLSLMNAEITNDQKIAIRIGLEEYCGQDTLGMVKILEVLRTL
jgi:hypothetical protein